VGDIETTCLAVHAGVEGGEIDYKDEKCIRTLTYLLGSLDPEKATAVMEASSKLSSP
jgi:predicted metal-binding protein